MQMTARLRSLPRRALGSLPKLRRPPPRAGLGRDVRRPVRAPAVRPDARTGPGAGAGRLLRVGRPRRRTAVRRRSAPPPCAAASPRSGRTTRPYNNTTWSRHVAASSPGSTGNFTGTTDEIIQWAACKWGFDENTLRAQVAKESYWSMLVGRRRRRVLRADAGPRAVLPTTRIPEGAKRSTAYNLDVALQRLARLLRGPRDLAQRRRAGSPVRRRRRMGLHRSLVLRPLVHPGQQRVRRRRPGLPATGASGPIPASSTGGRDPSCPSLPADGPEVKDGSDLAAAATMATSTCHSGRTSAGTVTSVDAAMCPANAASRAAITGPSSLPTTT